MNLETTLQTVLGGSRTYVFGERSSDPERSLTMPRPSYDVVCAIERVGAGAAVDLCHCLADMFILHWGHSALVSS